MTPARDPYVLGLLVLLIVTLRIARDWEWPEQ